MFTLIVLLGLLPLGAFPASAQTQGASHEPWDMFFQLGLPDSRGAKWVRANSNAPGDDALPQTGGENFTGNAWLVREERDGTVELIVGQAERIRARSMQRDSPQRTPRVRTQALLEVQIEPANLEKDIELLTSILTSHDEANAEESPGNDYRQREKVRGASGALLFLAHLHQQGRRDVARK